MPHSKLFAQGLTLGPAKSNGNFNVKIDIVVVVVVVSFIDTLFGNTKYKCMYSHHFIYVMYCCWLCPVFWVRDLWPWCYGCYLSVIIIATNSFMNY